MWSILGVLAAFIIVTEVATEAFDQQVVYQLESNPLWNSNGPLDNELTRKLRGEGFSYFTDRGAEADPRGKCFAQFGADKYWVVTYNDTTSALTFFAFEARGSILGRSDLSMKFDKVRGVIESSLKTDEMK